MDLTENIDTSHVAPTTTLAFEITQSTLTEETIEIPRENTVEEFADIDDLYQILTEELVNPVELPKDIGLYLECDEDDEEIVIVSSPKKSITPPCNNNQPRTVDIPAGKRSIYRLSFPENTSTNNGEDDRFHCDLCSKSFTRKTLLLDHKAGAHGLKDIFSCLLCKYKGDRYRHWRKHISRMHPNVTLEDMKNMSTKHGDNPGIAQKSMDSENHICDTNKTKNPPLDQLNDESTSNQCPVCLKCFDKKRSLVFHKRVHTKSRDHECGILGCIKAFKTSSALNEHKLTVHGPKVHNCPHDGCNKAYAVERDLQYHMKVHSKSFRCDVVNCRKIFRDKYNLDIHSKIHTGEKNLKCDFCDYVCVQRNSLNWHLKSKHKGNK